MNAVRCIYESVRERLGGVRFADFDAALKDWRIVPLAVAGETIGGVMIKGNEIHVGYTRNPGAAMRGHIRATVNALIAEHGSAVTKVDRTNARGLRFCLRLGFEVESDDGALIALRCTRSNYA